jgi:DnaJ domain
MSAAGEPQENPYDVLGVASDAPEAEVRSAYRRLVQRHHPDHNGGSPESAARFAQIQAAYAHIVGMRRGTAVPPPVTPRPGTAAPVDPAVQRRIDDMERELAQARAAEARAARVRAAQAAASRQAATPPPRKPTPEELGYFETEDSFSKILSDASEEVSSRWGASAKKRFTQRLVDLFGGRDG